MTYEELSVKMRGIKCEMSNQERKQEYAKGNLVDFQPYSIMSCDPAMAGIFGFTQKEYRESIEIQKLVVERKREEFGLEGLSVGMGLKGIGRAVGTQVIYPDDQIEYVGRCVLDDYADLAGYDVIKPARIPFMANSIERAHRLKEAFPDMGLKTSVAGPMTTAIAVRSVEKVMRDLRRNPDELHRLLAYSVACSLEWVKVMKKEFGKITCSFADPATSQNLISLKNFRRYSKPHMQDLIDGIKEITGSSPGIHICGKTKQMWEDLKEMGIASFSADDCEDIGEVKACMGETLPIAGNVPPVTVMRNGTIDDVIEAVKECLIKASDSKCGYTMDTGCQVPIGTPRQNIEAYIYAVKTYGKGARKGERCQGIKEYTGGADEDSRRM